MGSRERDLMEAVQSIFMHFNTVRQARQDLVPHNRLWLD